MFGYVRPRTDELRMKDYDRYQAAYCGLCRELGKQYGFLARFFVNYDLTFLYLLRASCKPAAETRRCWCPARICGRKRCVCDAGDYGPVAAFTVILCWEKLQDAIRDGGFFRRLGCKLLKLVFRRAYRRAAKRQPEFAALAEEQMQSLCRLEAERSSSIDATADAFAKLISGCAADLTEDAVRRPMQAVLYQTGRFLYLCDALDDLKKDLRTDSYNPLRYRFRTDAEGLSETDLQYLSQLMDSSVNLIGVALELLPMQAYEELLKNIVYLGLPTVFSAVKAGRFRAGLRRNPRKESIHERPV